MNARGFEHIRAVSFDGDMTLWDFEKVMRHALGQALAELRRCLPGEASARLTVDRMIVLREEVATQWKGRATLEEIRLRAFGRTIEFIDGDDPDLAAHLNAIYMKHRFEDIELYPDVLPALDALKSRYVLGLVSNGNSYPERCGLEGYFSFVVFAQDIGSEKPEAKIFQVACQRAGCLPGELLHVGDSLDADVRGALHFGALSAWLNRDLKPRQPDWVPDIEIHSLSELPALIQAPPRGGPGPR